MKTVVQISLDIADLKEALETAHLARRAGVDWLEAGTPFVMSQGCAGVRALRNEFPNVPIVADLKIMDGGYRETQMMAQSGANFVVVMERSHPETVKSVVKAGKDFNIKVMGDNMAADDMIASAERLEDLGCDYVIHHIGFDQRRGIRAAGGYCPTPLDQLREIVAAVKVPVQAVGGLTTEEAMRTPEYGAPMVVLGAPLVIEGVASKSGDELETKLRMICQKIHGYGDVGPTA